MPASLSQMRRRGIAPSWPESSDHIPASKSGVVRVGIITAQIVRENEATITNTGGGEVRPSGSGMVAGGNQRSHWTWSPGEYCNRRQLWAQQRDPFPEPRRRPRPANPLRDHRRRHQRKFAQEGPDPWFERVKRRHHRSSRIGWRRLRGNSPRHRFPRHSKPFRYRPNRHTLTAVKMPNLCPILQADHPSIVSGWQGFQRAKLDWFSKSADTK
jgi:hypothetical protein